MKNDWQLYDEQGLPIAGSSASATDIIEKGLLHAAAHVWVWRRTSHGVEILLQKRAGGKRTWPGRFDVSAAGHVDISEQPIEAALRETKEEIGLNLTKQQLSFVGVYRTKMETNMGLENELQWLYLFEMTNEMAMVREENEVSELLWRPLEAFIAEVTDASLQTYVPHGQHYFETITQAIARTTQQDSFSDQR